MTTQSLKAMLRSSALHVGVASALACVLIVTESDARALNVDEFGSERGDTQETITGQHVPEDIVLADHAGDCTCDDEDYADDYDRDYDEDYADDYDEDYDEDYADDYDRDYDEDYVDDYDEDEGDGYSRGHGGGHSNEQALTSAQERLQRLTNRSVGVRVKQYELGSGRTDGYWSRP